MHTWLSRMVLHSFLAPLLYPVTLIHSHIFAFRRRKIYTREPIALRFLLFMRVQFPLPLLCLFNSKKSLLIRTRLFKFSEHQARSRKLLLHFPALLKAFPLFLRESEKEGKKKFYKKKIFNFLRHFAATMFVKLDTSYLLLT